MTVVPDADTAVSAGAAAVDDDAVAIINASLTH